ncbi:MAG: hypothetical protein L6N94_07360 [Candidatus Methylarchaceae archaeon HK01M]|nr:hypothetical protein [Candidatus Methylarchaceae archaeon HK01M]
MVRPSGLKVLVILELFIASLGIASGLNLLADPSGKGLGLDVIIDKVPLDDFTLLGIWFLIIYGFLPVSLAYGLWTGKFWSWTVAMILAIVELIWVIGQIYFVGMNIWQAIIGVIALLTLYLLYRPSVKTYFGT